MSPVLTTSSCLSFWPEMPVGKRIFLAFLNISVNWPITVFFAAACKGPLGLLVGLLSQIIEPRSCINNDISYTFALSRGRSVRPRLQPHLLSYCQVGFCRRGPSCLPLFNAFVPCHWLSNGNQVDLKCDCNFFPLVGWVGWYLLLVKAPSAAVIPPQRPVMGCCVWERGSIQSPISLDRDRC